MFEENSIFGIEEGNNKNVDPEELETASVFLTDLTIDGSGSMCDNASAMQDCLGHYQGAIAGSKQADEMLVSKTVFNYDIESGGYVTPDDLDTSYSADGGTRLYDAIVDRHDRMLAYIDQLRKNGQTVRGCFVILSDGWDTCSNASMSQARNAIEDLKKQEITVAFISFGDEAKGIAEKLGVNPKNIMEVTNDEHELRKVMEIVSKSAISASKKANKEGNDPSESFFDFDV